MIRQPIVTIMGHVDHGKTSILDKIRGSAVAAREAGGITQAIGASIIPLGTIQKVCGAMLDALKIKITIPGLLFIDTPGHAAFTNLRKRGGNLADIAILVIDINDGPMPQTLESIQLLRSYKTPFVIAANKIDMIGGWQNIPGPVLTEIKSQSHSLIGNFETKLYKLIGKIYELGLKAERFDRVQDYTQEIAIVPVSAVTGAGIPELLMTITGLAQRFLEKALHTSADNPGKGTILEVKDQQGMGKIMDVIIYDGKLKVGDPIVVGGIDEPITTRVKALFEPAPLKEIREKGKFKSIKEVQASTGVRVVAPNIESVVAGMPLLVVSNNLEEIKAKIQEQVQEVLVTTEEKGIIIKADSLGSLEALSYLLKENKIPVKKASIGAVTKKDLSDGEAIFKKEPLDAIILGFNVPRPLVSSNNVKVITNSVIYKLIDDYSKWKDLTIKQTQQAEFDKLPKPCKIKIMGEGYVFRQNNPAIVGIEVIAGVLQSNTPLMNSTGKYLTSSKGIQHEQKNIEKAEKDKQVALSLPSVTYGRQINQGDILYSAISEDAFRKYKEFKQFLSDGEKDLLKEIAKIMREHNPVWGI